MFQLSNHVTLFTKNVFTKQQKLDLGTVDCYESFFEFLYADFAKEESTCINWSCTPDKKTTCKKINS